MIQFFYFNNTYRNPHEKNMENNKKTAASDRRTNSPETLLSKRENEVYSLILQGYENKAIAKKLFISRKTVEFHKENIKQKLNITQMKELYKLSF